MIKFYAVYGTGSTITIDRAGSPRADHRYICTSNNNTKLLYELDTKLALERKNASALWHAGSGLEYSSGHSRSRRRSSAPVARRGIPSHVPIFSLRFLFRVYQLEDGEQVCETRPSW